MAILRRVLEKLRVGLSKTRQKFANSFRALLAVGRKIDDDLLDELEATLIGSDVGLKTTTRIIDDLRRAYQEKRIERSEQILEFLKDDMKNYWPPADRSLHFAETGPTVILVAGVNGTGKTTSVAKLAWLLRQSGKKVILAAADTFRAAAVEQLTIWSERTGVEIVKHQSGADPGAVVFDACDAALARKADVLLVDTAGRLHTQDNLMRELAKIRRVVERKIPGAPHEVLLVLDATTGQNAIIQAQTFADAIQVSGLFLAKLDGTAKGGIVVAIRDQVSLPVKFIGLGEKPQDIEPFDPEIFVEALFE
ncbi:MAG: signal recognition particle-docking protein FtsY [Actinobacteria bacterium]|nr:signal recognition particle-docking protein FtsY [Actinomycetota bacterium]